MNGQGWTSTPNSRGTFDIIWSCAQTTALCAWVSICVNLPAPDSGVLELVKDKLYFTLLTFLGPEFVFLLAFTQLLSARASVGYFRDAGYSDWTLDHAFYADMGGISIKPPDWKRFPINAKQLHFLVTNKHMPYPEIPLENIRLRARSDGLGKSITIMQAFYFIVNTVARVSQGLAITTLELTVLGFVISMLATSICWWRKPKDVEEGHLIEIEKSIAQIIDEIGEAADEGYRDTPLDFISAERWSAQVLWNFYVDLLRKMRLFESTQKMRPVQRISSFTFPKPSCSQPQLVVLFISLTYVTIFFGAWHFTFPSQQEQVLWRVSSVIQWGVCAIVGIFEICYFTWPDGGSSTDKREKCRPAHEKCADHASHESFYQRFLTLWNRQFNFSVSKNPYFSVPLRSILVTTPLCATYCVCRWYLLLEDLIGLRAQPSSVYDTVNWTGFLPSF